MMGVWDAFQRDDCPRGFLAHRKLGKVPKTSSRFAMYYKLGTFTSRPPVTGDAENAGLENVGPNRRGGKGGTGKRGNIMCMGSEM